MCLYLLKAQEEAEARDLGIGLLRTSDELSEGEKGNGFEFGKVLEHTQHSTTLV